MKLRISGKHMDVGDAFRAHIESRLAGAFDKYYDGGASGHVTITKSTVSRTGDRFTADCMLHLDTGLTLQSSGGASDPMPAFEAAAERFEKRLRRYKRRLKAHPTGANGNDATDISYRVMAPLADLDDDEEEVDPASDTGPAIVAESTLSLRTMSVASAVEELDASDSPVYVFRNPGSGGVSIVYRRPDGNIGWIDPSQIETTPANGTSANGSGKN
ncbi:ribosome-associated translation inhibitor RaiA [Mesorhizobium sp. RP14(2022)]|uniref:Ribosome hibernation promoting factor n=1 Tax=Mesorhizobium liriopis TaxID=2953882 RepID=A0ABT1C3Q5_9HYPH|nr:ribosome-associated translation inhibitor RaiA [Mesorhizobium liriopis]MCO6049449.1 ribosome-associated translation inhibitor RaiA [Mesorhizobium liriopis]